MKTSHTIYSIDKKILNKLVQEFTDYMTNPYHEWRQSSRYDMDKFDYELGCDDAPVAEERGLRYNFQGEVLTQHLSKKLPREDTLSAHFISLIDTMYRRSFSTQDARFRINAETLKKLYGDIYPYMIKAVCKFDIFSGSFYHGFFISDYRIFHRERTFNSKVIKDIERNTKISKEWLAIRRKQAVDAINERMTNELGYSHKEAETFIQRYNNNIAKLRLVDKTSALEYLQSDLFKNLLEQKGKDYTRSLNYYSNIIIELSSSIDTFLSEPDDNGRFYHIGTRLPRSLRQYTNINYTLDCANSHLLLFNFFLFDYYLNKSINIFFNFNNNFNLFYLLSYFIYNNTYTTDFRKKLCKYLSNNNIDNDIICKIKSIPKDAWLYMYRSSHGFLWDDFMNDFNQSDRNELKQIMFASVFYTNKTKFAKDEVYAMSFKTKYPSVLKVINYYKRLCKRQCKENNLHKTKRSTGLVKNAIQLPHLMMRLESRIFTDILSRLFAKRIVAIGIHDAVAVLSEVSQQDVRHVMMDVYKKYGLVPTISDK